MANTHSLDLESGSSQYANIADAGQTGLDITGDITVEAWVKPESVGSNVIASKWEDNSQRSWFLSIDSNEILMFVSANGGYVDNATNELRISHTVNTGEWKHIAVAFDVSAGSAEFFVNGASIGTDTVSTTSLHNSTAPFAIGTRNIPSTASDFWDGLIDEVRIWNDLRTEAEILANYQVELVGNEGGLVAYYKLNNGYLDETANNNDLTAVNTPAFSEDVPFVGATADTRYAYFM